MVDILRMRTTSSRSSTYPKNVQSATSRTRVADVARAALPWMRPRARCPRGSSCAASGRRRRGTAPAGARPPRATSPSRTAARAPGSTRCTGSRTARASPACRSATCTPRRRQRRRRPYTRAPPRRGRGARRKTRRTDPIPRQYRPDFEPTSAWIRIATPPSRNVPRAGHPLRFRKENPPSVRASSCRPAGIDASPPRRRGVHDREIPVRSYAGGYARSTQHGGAVRSSHTAPVARRERRGGAYSRRGVNNALVSRPHTSTRR